MVKMENKIWSVPRTALQWLDDNSVVVTSLDDKWENGHCILLNTVGPLLVLLLPSKFRKLARVKRLMLMSGATR